jgi:hypothetical protein
MKRPAGVKTLWFTSLFGTTEVVPFHKTFPVSVGKTTA